MRPPFVTLLDTTFYIITHNCSRFKKKICVCVHFFAFAAICSAIQVPCVVINNRMQQGRVLLQNDIDEVKQLYKKSKIKQRYCFVSKVLTNSGFGRRPTSKKDASGLAGSFLFYGSVYALPMLVKKPIPLKRPCFGDLFVHVKDFML